jgi:hypothetical protein
MRDKLLRAFLPLLCLGAVACVPASAGAVTVGVSDNGAAMFGSSWFKALHIKQARLLVSWDIAVNKARRTELTGARTWLQAASEDGVAPLIDFQAAPGAAGNHIPSIKEYTAAVRAFIKDFPSVRQYVPWNEPDFNFRSLSKNPALAAGYFNVLVQNCHGCTIVAGDVYLDAAHLGAWLQKYKKGLRYRPSVWALHPYDDVQGHKTSQIQTMVKYIGRAQLWLTEISGVITRGHWHGGILHQSAGKQGTDEKFLFSLPGRFHQITRIYHYQWQGFKAAPWDSGLLDYNGNPRPAYYVVQKAAK